MFTRWKRRHVYSAPIKYVESYGPRWWRIHFTDGTHTIGSKRLYPNKPAVGDIVEFVQDRKGHVIAWRINGTTIGPDPKQEL